MVPTEWLITRQETQYLKKKFQFCISYSELWPLTMRKIITHSFKNKIHWLNFIRTIKTDNNFLTYVSFCKNLCTVKVMILSRYRYSVTVIHRRLPLPNVTDRYRMLPLLAFQAFHKFFYKTLNIYSKNLYNDRYRYPTQVSVTFGNAW